MPNAALAFRSLLQGAQRVAVLGVGSLLRGDDAAGMLAAEELQKHAADESRGPIPALAVFLGETAPENLTGPIKAFAPTHLIVIDAADMGRQIGYVDVVEPGHVADTSASTHSLPLNALTAYLQAELGCKVVIVGIQANCCEFGQPPCHEVTSAASRVAQQIILDLTDLGSADDSGTVARHKDRGM